MSVTSLHTSLRKREGFTLIELLIVIGIIAILAAIVIVAVNPARQFAQANNAQRRSDVKAVLDAVGQYQVDNSGALPSVITTTTTNMGTGSGLINLTSALIPTYISGLPFDPLTGSATDTKYQISKDSNSRVTVTASDAELNESISVTR